LRPVETKLKSLKGLKEMKSAAYTGGGYVLVEFDPVDGSRRRADRHPQQGAGRQARPADRRDEPTVNEVNISEFPVLVVTLSGHVPERVLTAAAKELRDRIEEVPGVLEGTIQGSRDELVEAIIDPVKLSSYGLRLEQMIQGIGASNSLVAAGAIEGSEGKYAIKVPALIETPEDVANLPVVAGPNAVVRVRDLATVRSTFKDAETITRLDGKPAIAIEVKKRIGANVVETIEGAKKVADDFVAEYKKTHAGPSGDLHAGQVRLRQPASERFAEPRADRRHPRVHRHPLRAFGPRLAC
jgi:multidrug efflux pump